MASNPKYMALLKEMADTHNRKNEDYASAADPYSNFRFSGQLGAMFTDPVDISFAVLIGVKLARLGELRGKGKAPKNEAIADTHLDLAVYSSLWASFYKQLPRQENTVLIPTREVEAQRARRAQEIFRDVIQPQPAKAWDEQVLRGQSSPLPSGEESY